MDDNDEKKEQRNMQMIVRRFITAHSLFDEIQQYCDLTGQESDELEKGQILKILKKKFPGIFNEMVKELENMERAEQEKLDPIEKEHIYNHEEEKIDRQSQMNLIVQLNDLKLLIDVEEIEPNLIEDQRLFVHCCFLDQRQSSKNGLSLQSELYFETSFLFSLMDKDFLHDICEKCLKYPDQQILVVLVVENIKNGQRQILGSQKIEWRKALTQYVELKEPDIQIHKQGELFSPIAEISAQISITNQRQIYDKKTVMGLIQNQIKEDDNRRETFFEYCKEWWEQFKKFDGSQEKIVKIFGEDERGNCIPLVQFVNPLWKLQGLDTPEHAGRFVSLIPLRKIVNDKGVKREIWSVFHLLFIRRGGDVQDHCILLCSLLLGFGLDAYVVSGTNSAGEYQWVMTQTIKNVNGQLQVITVFWDTISGLRFSQDDPYLQQVFKTVGSVFNHESYYANIQQNDLAYVIDMNLRDKTKWFPMNKQKIHQFKEKYSNNQILLQPSSINVYKIEYYVRGALRGFIQDYRIKIKFFLFNDFLQDFFFCKIQIYQYLNLVKGLYVMRFDEELEAQVETLLQNYENSHIFSKPQPSKYLTKQTLEQLYNKRQRQFQVKFYEIRNHFDPKRIFLELRDDKKYDILRKTEQKPLFGLNVKLFTYPENFFVIWVALSANYSQ